MMEHLLEKCPKCPANVKDKLGNNEKTPKTETATQKKKQKKESMEKFVDNMNTKDQVC